MPNIESHFIPSKLYSDKGYKNLGPLHSFFSCKNISNNTDIITAYISFFLKINNLFKKFN
jgi:hypothetical protein